MFLSPYSVVHKGAMPVVIAVPAQGPKITYFQGWPSAFSFVNRDWIFSESFWWYYALKMEGSWSSENCVVTRMWSNLWNGSENTDRSERQGAKSYKFCYWMRDIWFLNLGCFRSKALLEPNAQAIWRGEWRDACAVPQRMGHCCCNNWPKEIIPLCLINKSEEQSESEMVRDYATAQWKVGRLFHMLFAQQEAWQFGSSNMTGKVEMGTDLLL